ncbi:MULTISPECIES: MarR family winged helix-turn-helix transcriptional regulator [Gammaproteobacteria]|uniref:MarR family transcriptional regulator n=1 Tax=Vibrio diazotrophicus TaxID=685 RepID=A0A329E5U4_VIBDI|nr:MarR family transcriptional regulator [Vibrio diazotrophicus]RAS59131.1 MarR family transcriptional regulator [Vibrio diazotrophicus]
MPDNQLSLDNQVCFALYSASLAMTQLYKPMLEPLGLTYTQYLILLTLWEEDGIGLKDIGSKLGQKSGALTPVIKRMETDGLVQRVRLPHDERSLSVRLTLKGRSLEKDARNINTCIADACGLESEELIDLKDKIILLRKNISNQIK